MTPRATEAEQMADWAVAVSTGVAALVFCQQPETLPVFLAWLAQQPGMPDPTPAMLRHFDAVLTAAAAQAFKATDQMRGRG